MKDFLNNIHFEDYAKDNKLNMSNVLMNTNNVIENKLVALTVLSILYMKNENLLAEKFIINAGDNLDESLIFGAKAAANIMMMNNIYYRGKHLLDDKYKDIQAGLRMGVYAKHGIDKTYFEFACLSLSFINGCEFCVKSHAALLEKEGMSKEQIHEALRIASIFNTIKEVY